MSRNLKDIISSRVSFSLPGACFTLRDQKWALAIECCLKGLMTAFVCHDHHDEKLLEQLVSQTCPPHFKATIIVSRFKVHVCNIMFGVQRSLKFSFLIMNLYHRVTCHKVSSYSSYFIFLPKLFCKIPRILLFSCSF